MDTCRYQCFVCNEEGHRKKDCSRKEGQQGSGPNVDKSASIVAESAGASSSSADRDDWILDSGATDCVTSAASDFLSYERLAEHRQVRFL